MTLPLDTKTTKGQIIYCLANEWPLSAKEIYKVVKKKFERGITYQAIHKAIQELDKEKIIERKDAGYGLSAAWIDRMGEFLKTLKSSLAESKFGQLETIGKTTEVREFYTIVDLARFLLFDFIQRENKKKNGIMCWQRMNDSAGLSKEEINALRLNAKENNWLILCKRNNSVATMFSKVYEKMGINVKFSSALPDYGYDIWIFGDFMAHVYYPSFVNRFWDISFNIRRVVDLDFESLLHGTQQKLKEPVKMYLFKDKSLVADYIRQLKPFFPDDFTLK